MIVVNASSFRRKSCVNITNLHGAASLTERLAEARPAGVSWEWCPWVSSISSEFMGYGMSGSEASSKIKLFIVIFKPYILHRSMVYYGRSPSSLVFLWVKWSTGEQLQFAGGINAAGNLLAPVPALCLTSPSATHVCWTGLAVGFVSAPGWC